MSIAKIENIESFFLTFYPFFGVFKNFLGVWVLSWQTSLLFIEGELARGGSMPVASGRNIPHSQLLNISVSKFTSPVLLNLLGNILPYCTAVQEIRRTNSSSIDLLGRSMLDL